MQIIVTRLPSDKILKDPENQSLLHSAELKETWKNILKNRLLDSNE
jgi:hypothetical protein